MTPSADEAAFDEVADLYDRARPGYPETLLDDLISLTKLKQDARILEIGCGSGQITLPMAQRGYSILAIEKGRRLASIARSKVGEFLKVDIWTGRFEDLALPDASFDLVMAATSFHWLDPAERVEKSARVLQQGGHLAVISTRHVMGGDEEFFHKVQDCYLNYMPGTKPGEEPPGADQVPDDAPDPEMGTYFGTLSRRRYEWDVEYTTQAYIELLWTYSSHLALNSSRRNALLACIADMINTQFGGRIKKRYLAQLAISSRKDAT